MNNFRVINRSMDACRGRQAGMCEVREQRTEYVFVHTVAVEVSIVMLLTF